MPNPFPIQTNGAPSPLATFEEEALKKLDAWAIFAVLERCAWSDTSLVRALGGREFETRIADLSLARHERLRRSRPGIKSSQPPLKPAEGAS